LEKIPLVIICSPTATGKTGLALELASEFGGEIVSADSVQVYRYLDIGSAKPSPEERKRIKHYFIDVADPDEEFNAALFSEQARAIIANLHRQKKPVFVAGGTGLYIRALLKGIIETPAVDENIRNYYRELRDRHGKEYVYQLLQQRDEEAARRFNPNDSVRVIRALEVLEQSGESILAIQKRHLFADCPYRTLKLGLQVERGELQLRIVKRTQKMIAEGLVEEVQSLLAKGYSDKLKSLQSLGYKHVIEYIRGNNDWEKTEHLINRDTWHYAKRQMTWFNADKEIRWYGPDMTEEIIKDVAIFRKQKDFLQCNQY
jgi:tRNA dimethylallyltransferase